jgi:hypothetical protein
MYKLFTNIPKGSIMLWKIASEKELPQSKELFRLLKLKEFKYYKTNGHYRNYINSIAKLLYIIHNEAKAISLGYWDSEQTTDFLFTAKELENNDLFQLNYSESCLGSYYVEEDSIKELNNLLRKFYQAWSIREELKAWPEKIIEHQKIIKALDVSDSAIEQFDIPALILLSRGYGDQAYSTLLNYLKDWHNVHFWKMKQPKPKNANLETLESPIA